MAAGHGQKDVVESLLANHAELNGKTQQGWTPLRVAALSGQKDVAELLRQRGDHKWAHWLAAITGGRNP